MLQSTSINYIPSIVQSLRDTHKSRSLASISRRKEILTQIYRALDTHYTLICDALWSDLHKHARHVTMTELGALKNEIVECIVNLDKWAQPEARKGDPLVNIADSCQIQREPLGVVLIITPWNFPFFLSIGPIVSAIAAGNCCLLKPSDLSPHSTAALTHIFTTLNIPEIRVVNGGVPETTAVLLEQFDMIFYTGGAAVGKIVLEAAAKHFTPTILELGGKCPAVVDAGCDIETTARRIMWAKCMNAGQVLTIRCVAYKKMCVSPDYVLCHEKHIDEFVAACELAIKTFFGDDPLQSEFYGRIINKHHYERVFDMIEKQRLVEGCKVAVGGEHSTTELYIAPTIVIGVGMDGTKNALMSQEIFGPVLPVIAIKSADEAIEFINTQYGFTIPTLTRRDKPLAAYIFSKSTKTTQDFIARTSSGGVVVNDTAMHLAVTDLPFGGVGRSGMGAYHGKHGFDAFSHKKAILIRPHGLDVLNLPRYSPISELMIGVYEKLLVRSLPKKWYCMLRFLQNLIDKRGFQAACLVVGVMIGRYLNK